MKRRLFWIVELFIWLLILSAVSGLIMFAKYSYKKNFNTYQIFLPDVDGLIDGSPVKILGIQVGYVSQINIVGEDVYVKFIITEPNIKIPAGSIATVEFSGLGGSKSLELYPPKGKVKPSDKFIIAQSPKRIHDSLWLLNDMFNKVMDITFEFSRFMNKVGLITNSNPKTEDASKMANDLLNVSDNWIDRAQKQIDKVTVKLNRIKNKNDKKTGDVNNGNN